MRVLSHSRPRHRRPSGPRSRSASSEPRGVASEREQAELRAAPSRVQPCTVRFFSAFLPQKCERHLNALCKDSKLAFS